MHKFKQGMAAFALIATLGFVVPGLSGGPAAAGPPVGHDNTDEFWFYCDLNKDGIYNETPYHVVSAENNNGSFLDLDSSTVLSYSYDLIDEKNVPYTYDEQVAAGDPDAPVATKTEIFRADPSDPRQNGKGNKNGKFAQAVPCHENQVEPGNEFTSGTDEITACCEPLIDGAHYHVFYSRTWYVTVTGHGQGSVNVAGADHGKLKHKDGGKHHSKGKHGK
jgi:hypothetical protein